MGSHTTARVHGKGDARLDQVIDFVAFVAKPMPLPLLLDEVPRRIATIVRAEVASLYLLEGEGDVLVLRGNVGFPKLARGKIRLPVGEGITGLAVECMRPMSAEFAPAHERYRPFPELREERFPVFLAVPILGPGRALGAVVVQRAGSEPFSPDDLNLIVALTAPISAGVRHAHLLDDLRNKKAPQSRRAGGGTRKVTLAGTPRIPGRVLGAIAAVKRPAISAQVRGQPEDPRLLRTAFDVAEKALAALVNRSSQLEMGREAEFLTNYLLIVSDERLRERTFELVSSGQGVAQSLSTVAREVSRVANGIVGDPYLQERARDIEDLCDALLMLASPDPRAELPSKPVIVGDELTVFDLLVTARAQPVGIALTDRARGPRTRLLLHLLGVPAIVGVEGLFRWASPGDLALMDADHGLLVINPSRADVASVRAERRSVKPTVTADEAESDLFSSTVE